jgi:hypothetical protein
MPVPVITNVTKKGLDRVSEIGSPASTERLGAKIGPEKVTQIAYKAGQQFDAIRAKEKANPASVLRGASALPKLHKGGIVKKTAAYKMQKGEGVVPAKAMKGMKAGIRALAAKGKK